MPSPFRWSDFQPLIDAPALTTATLAELLDGGQAFRWRQETPEIWLGQWSDCIVRLKTDHQGRLSWSAPKPVADRASHVLSEYLFGHNTNTMLDALPWRSDPHLARCLAAFPGLTILLQPFGETLLGFLCSATKQIVQIKQMIALIAERHGTTIAGAYRRLPTWTELAAIPEQELRACLLGFRARYIHQTAQFLLAHPGWLEETELLPYPEGKTRLCELPGVGEKVADCVLLFGAGKLEAFPVDTWIIKSMARRYGLDGWTPAQVAHFGRTHFGAHAGLAQQYLFAYERAQGKAYDQKKSVTPSD